MPHRQLAASPAVSGRRPRPAVWATGVRDCQASPQRRHQRIRSGLDQTRTRRGRAWWAPGHHRGRARCSRSPWRSAPRHRQSVQRRGRRVALPRPRAGQTTRRRRAAAGSDQLQIRTRSGRNTALLALARDVPRWSCATFSALAPVPPNDGAVTPAARTPPTPQLVTPEAAVEF